MFIHQTFFYCLTNVLFWCIITDGSINIIANFAFGNDYNFIYFCHFIYIL